MKLFGKRKWEIRRTIWPYPEGYGTVFFKNGKMTVVDTGLSKEEATRIVREENEREKHA
jgi:hypothetical protein